MRCLWVLSAQAGTTSTTPSALLSLLYGLLRLFLSLTSLPPSSLLRSWPHTITSTCSLVLTRQRLLIHPSTNSERNEELLAQKRDRLQKMREVNESKAADSEGSAH